MNGCVLIVDANTPELTSLAAASVQRYAPDLDRIILPSIGKHAETIENFRTQESRWRKYDAIVLLDSDAAILSDLWWPLVQYRFATGSEAVGGQRSRGDASQMFVHGKPILHAACLAIKNELFRRVTSFHPEWDIATEFQQIDTAGRVSLEATKLSIFPFRRVGHGPLYPGIQVGEYFDPTSGFPLWVHAWRGTSSKTPRWRHRLRKAKKLLGSSTAKTMLRHETRVEEYLTRTKELIYGA